MRLDLSSLTNTCTILIRFVVICIYLFVAL